MGDIQSGRVAGADDPSARLDLSLSVGPLRIDPHKVIYSTIILMTAFAIYDEGTSPLRTGAFVEIVALSIAPLFALSMAHAFSEALDLQIRNGRRLNGRDRRHLAATNLEYLYIAIPPLIVIAVLGLIGWDANDIISIVQVLGIASLFMWGVFAARMASLGALRQWVFGLNYAFMGMVVIGVEMLLTH